ncbi:LysR family transcriptional regulator [Bradyrhizobium sp. B124]|uniref:LysR family transcriptional regulator n=1 Tax=Bradyrhizobium sp. B124 TaxID=3140245 RepID=UPI0031844DAB
MNHLTGLRVFKRIVELGSFSRAADDMTISQSTVTKHVTQLEKHLGTRLLNRNTRGISLTEEGRIYYERSKSIISEIDEADASVGRRSKALEGVLRISTSVTFGRRIVSPLLIEFMREQPHLKADIACEDGYVDLVSRGIDVALRMGRLPDSCLGSRFLGSNPWVMVASPRYLRSRGTPYEPKDLAGHDCIVYSSVQDDAAWQLRSSAGTSTTIVVNGRLRSNNLSTVLIAVKLDLGIAILPRYVAVDELRAGNIVTVLDDFALPDQQLHAVFPSPKLVPRKSIALINFLLPRFKGDWWNRPLLPCAIPTSSSGSIKIASPSFDDLLP